MSDQLKAWIKTLSAEQALAVLLAAMADPDIARRLEEKHSV